MTTRTGLIELHTILDTCDLYVYFLNICSSLFFIAIIRKIILKKSTLNCILQLSNSYRIHSKMQVVSNVQRNPILTSKILFKTLKMQSFIENRKRFPVNSKDQLEISLDQLEIHLLSYVGYFYFRKIETQIKYFYKINVNYSANPYELRRYVLSILLFCCVAFAVSSSLTLFIFSSPVTYKNKN